MFAYFEKKCNKSENKGLISADRSNKATLLLTIPRSLFKSSAKDLALENLDLSRLQCFRSIVCSFGTL